MLEWMDQIFVVFPAFQEVSCFAFYNFIQCITKPNSIMIRHVNVKNVKNKRPSLLYYKTKGKTLKEIIDE